MNIPDYVLIPSIITIIGASFKAGIVFQQNKENKRIKELQQEKEELERKLSNVDKGFPPLPKKQNLRIT